MNAWMDGMEEAEVSSSSPGDDDNKIPTIIIIDTIQDPYRDIHECVTNQCQQAEGPP